jgi:geranylgeranyl diphosphate synthase type II
MSAAPTPLLQEFLQRCQSRVESRLQAIFEGINPADTTPNLVRALQYACLNGGKRIRPVLVYGTCRALGVDLERADNAACAVELVHCYSLAHDDLPSMDNDDMRRGKASLHKAFGEATAILAGDALQSLAFELLSRDNGIAASNRLRMVEALSRAIGAEGMVAGQDLDFTASGQKLEEHQLAKLHGLKTGALIRACLTLGALCKDEVDDTSIAALDQYGRHIGLAFQVQDDILDVVANTEALGKPQGSDQVHDKPTYVSILGLEAARKKASELTEQAHEALQAVAGEAAVLHDLASYITARSH